MTNSSTMGELDFLTWIGEEDNAVGFFESRRWPHGGFCHECGSVETYSHRSRKFYYHCKDCRKQFSCKVGTIMESSRIPVREWLFVMYKISVSLKGISFVACQGAGSTAEDDLVHAPAHQGGLRQQGDLSLRRGRVRREVRRWKGSHQARVQEEQLGWRFGWQAASAGNARAGRGDRARARAFHGCEHAAGTDQILEPVLHGSTIYTDDHGAYVGLKGLSYKHETVRHKSKEYVRGEVHTNSIESAWAILERTIMGVHHRISVKRI